MFPCASAMIGKKIFRPWDSSQEKSTQNFDQDATISTTTEPSEDVTQEIRVPILHNENLSEKIEENPKNCVQLCDNKVKSECLKRDEPSLIPRFPNFYVPGNYEAMLHHRDMWAQSLGVPLPGSDPMLLESLAQGYAMEEYARILSQDHHARMLSHKKQRPKKFRCPHCNVGFSNNGQLKGHIRIHTGERPFRCDEKNCGKTFTRNEELTRHKRIHSGLRPFPCTTCGKRFGRKDHLKKHVRTHVVPPARTGLQLVPVVLPADAWASIPPSAGLPAFTQTDLMPPIGHPSYLMPIFDF